MTTPVAATSTESGQEHRNPQGRMLCQLEATPAAVDPAADRRRRAEALATLAGGDRQPLNELRSGFLRRLHRASDDFDSAEGLRTVEAALSMTPRPEGLWAWPRRERDRQRRWWHRRRRQG
jgi:hypothetical protein